MTETFQASSAVQLAVIERSGFVESRHTGSAIVLRPDGSIFSSRGDVQSPIFPRSTMKPFQAIAVMNAGVPLEGASAVLATASHSGTPAHIGLVRELLSRAHLGPDALHCPADWPADSVARNELIREGAGKAPLYMNCSGKHAAMLLACVQNGWPTDSYLEPKHPLQALIRDVVERLTGERILATGVDGCGAPVHAMSLESLARGIQRITTASPASPFALYRNSALLTHAVLSNGWAIDGPGRANTIVIDELGVFAKAGAEGMMIAAAPDGTTLALKILDGSLRASTVVALALLVDAGSLTRAAVDSVADRLHLAVHGGSEIVGAVRADYQ